MSDTPAAAPAPVPATAPIMRTEATFAQLLKQAGVDLKDEPSKLVADLKALPSAAAGKVKSADWPFVFVAAVAFAALALHFVKLPVL